MVTENNFIMEKVTAYDKDKNELGKGTVKLYKETKESLDLAIKDLTISVIIKTLNRQLKTDVRNNLARKLAPMTQLKKLAETNAEAKRVTEKLIQ